MYKQIYNIYKAVKYTTAFSKENCLTNTKISSYYEVVRAASGGGSSGSGGSSVISHY